ncbi:MAG: CHAT domain-containing protein, partial [Trebonia sp.]
MRVTLDVEDREGELFAVVTVPGHASTRRPVRWAGARRLLVAKDEQLSDKDADALATAVETGHASAENLGRYGACLFDAAFGAETWRVLTSAAADARALHLELAIRGRTPAVQALRWEALHDGTAPVAAKGTGGHGQLSVAIVRLIPAAPSSPAKRQWRLSPVTRIPRVLFAVGSRLTDPRVRPGAEFMGIMRHLERKGGAIQPRVLEQATVQTLTEQVELFQPDVLHIIGHGRRDEVEGRVKLQLRPQPSDAAGDEWVTAGQLLGVFAAAGHTPAMVILSACQTASPEHVNALPFAAELVAGGVPVAVAMAGNIEDTACRVFTRALTRAISDGVPVTEAVVSGRRAAFHERPAPSSADWLLPVVFLSGDVAEDARLVDTAAIRAARQRCHVLDLDWEPVFCGRGEFITAMDRLLNAADDLNVLVAHTDDETKSYGGMRLLRELAART